MLRIPPNDLLACPNCQSEVGSGFFAHKQYCETCQLNFFDLNGLPCWFVTGLKQRDVWQDIFSKIIEHSKKNLKQSEAYDLRLLLPSSQERLKKQKKINTELFESVRQLLADSGLKSIANPDYSNHDAKHILEYYELLLRDWAWDSEDASENHLKTSHLKTAQTQIANVKSTHENANALARIKDALTASKRQLGHIWVVGCGAGRLSVDVHVTLHAETTIALDANLLLINAAHRIASQQLSWHLSENTSYPQRGFIQGKTWTIPPIKYSTDELKNWFAMAGDAWNPALKPESFDTILTPWFMDVNGKEPAALIGLVQKYLKPGGLWINSGPLLYSASLCESQRLHHEEIIELLHLAGFTIHYQDTQEDVYLNSPLNAQQRVEQIWTFAATAPSQDKNTQIQTQAFKKQKNTPYPWIALPHLPIPKSTPLNTHGSPALEQLAALVDGKHSINTIADIMKPNLAQGKDPLHVVRSAFLEFLIQDERY